MVPRTSSGVMMLLALTLSLSHGERCTDDLMLTPATMNKNIVEMEYAVRGEIVVRAQTIEEELKKNPDKYPFSEIIYCNIGNPQRLGQKPITFHSQVMAILNYPALIEEEKLFPNDVRERARSLLDNIPGGLGSYSHSQGIPYVRRSVANFIEKRDGFPSDPDAIFLTNGASPAIRMVMQFLIAEPQDAILLPNPQYPLYSATLQELGGRAVPYTLDESSGWGLEVSALQSAVDDARAKGLNPRGLVVINPGNPTGQCLTKDNIETIIAFCVKERLVLLADEVYQENVYNPDRPFSSFKKVYRTLEKAADSRVANHSLELFSFHSVSKGVLGECGRRGGYVEAVNAHPDVSFQMYKALSVSLCANTAGQAMVELMVNPPQKGSHSHSLYKQETADILSSLKRRAIKLVELLNDLEGVHCNPSEGAMYAFPRISLPKKAVAAAKKEKQEPDAFYALKLLEATGICVVPGGGFLVTDLPNDQQHQYYFRTTFLPPEDKLDGVMDLFRSFHKKFMDSYK